jgi:hypothetical protein
MSKRGRFQSQRARAGVGVIVVAAALAAAGVLVGVGVAKTSLKPADLGTTTTVPSSGKVTICHKTHSKKHPQVTITISVSAWPAHQKHGDTLGACAPPGGTTTTTTVAAPVSAPGKSDQPHGKSDQPHGQSGQHGNGKGHG